jgi:hypothetical protein
MQVSPTHGGLDAFVEIGQQIFDDFQLGLSE